jgi:hypothetical protein
VRVIIESSAQRGWASEPGRLVVPEIAAVLTILCGRGAEDKRKAKRGILDHRVLQIESFERNVAACAVGADVLYRCQSRNHGQWANVSSCLRFAAEMSLALSGLMSGASNISCSCSMSSIMRSTSIPSQYPT